MVARTRSWKASRCALVALALACALPPSAAARDMTGKAGVGFTAQLDRALEQAPSLTFRYWRDALSFEFLFGFSWDLVRDRLRAERTIHAGFGALWMIYGSRELSVSVGGRLFAEVATLDSERSSISILIDPSDGRIRAPDCLQNTLVRVRALLVLPMQVEYFLSDQSSITAAVGVSATGGRVLDDSGCDRAEPGPYVDDGTTTIGIAGRYSGGVGYTYYF